MKQPLASPQLSDAVKLYRRLTWVAIVFLVFESIVCFALVLSVRHERARVDTVRQSLDAMTIRLSDAPATASTATPEALERLNEQLDRLRLKLEKERANRPCKDLNSCNFALVPDSSALLDPATDGFLLGLLARLTSEQSDGGGSESQSSRGGCYRFSGDALSRMESLAGSWASKRPTREYERFLGEAGFMLNSSFAELWDTPSERQALRRLIETAHIVASCKRQLGVE